ncbi:MAG: HRDC domain-containing protein [Elusimicrobia bacterium]|nr:HRDC domain-containing protein [Elusimicrobiota bacterium]
MDYTFVENQKDFDALVPKLAKQKFLALDTESNSLYVYKEQFCLLQIASEHINAVVDTLRVDIRPLLPVFADPKVEKILHSADSDIKVIKASVGGTFENIFDVMVASKYLGMKKCGLESLVGEFFGVALNKKFQKADWGRRPLSKEMLDYAITDVLYLYKLRELLAAQLSEKNRLEEIKDQFRQLARVEPVPFHFDEKGFSRLHNARQLNGRGLAVLRELYLSREVAAIRRNVPSFKIISEDLMLRLAVAPREGIENLDIFKGVTNYVLANHGPWIREALQKGLKVPEVTFPRREVSHEKRVYFDSVKTKFNVLKLWRKTTAAKRNMLPEAILGNDILERIAFASPRTVEDFQTIRGLAGEKLLIYAADILDFLKHHKA